MNITFKSYLLSNIWSHNYVSPQLDHIWHHNEVMQIKRYNGLGFKFWDDESSINFQPSSFSTFLLFHMYKQLSLITLHAKFQLHRYAALWHPPLQFLPRLPRKRLPDSEIYYRNIETVYIKRFLAKLWTPTIKSETVL